MTDPAVDILNELGAIWTSDFDQYARGDLRVSQIHCLLCNHAPCDCPEFGTPEYLALVDRRHNRGGS